MRAGRVAVCPDAAGGPVRVLGSKRRLRAKSAAEAARTVASAAGCGARINALVAADALNGAPAVRLADQYEPATARSSQPTPTRSLRRLWLRCEGIRGSLSGMRKSHP